MSVSDGRETFHYLQSTGPNCVSIVYYSPGSMCDGKSDCEGKYIRFLTWSTLTAAKPSFLHKKIRRETSQDRFSDVMLPRLESLIIVELIYSNC